MRDCITEMAKKEWWSWNRGELALAVETRLVTYMSNGTTPAELIQEAGKAGIYPYINQVST